MSVEGGAAIPHAQPINTINKNNSMRGGASNGINIRSNRVQHPPQNGGIVIFRIIVITIIICSLLWGYLIIQITSTINSSTSTDAEGGFASPMMLARPGQAKRPYGSSRIGWIIQHKIKQMQLQIRKVPLLDVAHMDSPLLIITYKRADYLERTLWKVFENHPAQKIQRRNGDASIRGKNYNIEDTGRVVGAPIIISQDGSNEDVRRIIETYRQLFEMKLGVPVYRIEHTRSNSEPKDPFALDNWVIPYKLLAVHYGWALEQTFSGAAYNDPTKQNRHIPNHPSLPQRVIILEEDIEIADDFFSFMNATADLLDKDDTLLAVSAFNDNGKEHLTADAKRLVRSDFFPGLGWMMSRNVWDGTNSHPHSGLKNNWAPGGFWDDWLRENNQRRGRQIIRPEVSRTFHFGNVDGASGGENSNILNQIELEENDIHWEGQDLSYLKSSVFADEYWKRVSSAKLVESVVEAKSRVAHSDVRLLYSDFEQFKQMAEQFDIMQDEKAGVPRTGYEGIVEIRYGRGRFFIFLSPPYLGQTSDKPSHFGEKTWKKYSKDDLMSELGIKSIPEETWNNW